MITAVMRVSGAGRIAEFRENLRWLLVRDIDAGTYSEHHGEDTLEYRFRFDGGMPFPAFSAASSDFPELVVELEWENHVMAERGRASFAAGKVVDSQTALIGDALAEVDIEIAGDGALYFGFACIRRDEGAIGYCASATRHAYWRTRDGGFDIADAAEARWNARVEGDRRVPLDASIEPALLVELEDMAFRFAGEWLWYDEAAPEQTALERKRFVDHGWPVKGANLKTEKVLHIGVGQRFSTLAARSGQFRDALYREFTEMSR